MPCVQAFCAYLLTAGSLHVLSHFLKTLSPLWATPPNTVSPDPCLDVSSSSFGPSDHRAPPITNLFTADLVPQPPPYLPRPPPLPPGCRCFQSSPRPASQGSGASTPPITTRVSRPCPVSQSVSSVIQSCLTLFDPMDCSMPGLPVHHQLLEFTQIHVHRVGDAIHCLILCRPLLLLPSIFPSIRVFSKQSALCNRWPKYWSFSFRISPSNEYLGLISFRMDWLDLPAVQGTVKSLLQHHR